MKTLCLIGMLLVAIYGHTQDSLRVYFLGNSFTEAVYATETLPSLLSKIADYDGKHFEFTIYTELGQDLSVFSDNPSVMFNLESKHWDYVVLQDRSTQALQQPANFVLHNTKLADSIRHYNSCSAVVLFEVWGKNFTSSGLDYQEQQLAIQDAYFELADSLETLIAPVGRCWLDRYQNHNPSELWSSDASHQSNFGNYLAALCFYAAFFNDIPANLYIPAYIDSTTANSYVNSIADVMFSDRSVWKAENRNDCLQDNDPFGIEEPDPLICSLIGSQVSCSSTIEKVELYDLLGRVKQIENDQLVGLKTGIYILHVRDVAGNEFIQKVFIE